MLTNKRFTLILLVQLLLIITSSAFAWLLRFDFTFPQRQIFLSALPLLVILRLVTMARFNLFHGYWRYTGMSDALDIAKSVGIGSTLFLIAERWVLGVTMYPLSVYFIEAMMTALSLGGVRMLSRAFMQRMQHTTRSGNKTVVIIGAGSDGDMLLRELPHSGFTAVALVDDDPVKKGVSLHGVRVAGRVSDLPDVVRRYCPDELMIAIRSANGEQMRRITDFCHQTGLRFRTIPGLAEQIHGTAAIDQLREVKLDDLLGRDSVKFNLDTVRKSITGRVVMVTGAAGSIGSELCHQLLGYSPARLVCVDQAETPLFDLQNSTFNSTVDTVFRVADISDSNRMRDLILENGVRIIFHAAAYKHVPLMEQNLQEALQNNVFGLFTLLDVADQCGCEDFLLVSSDKAVNPSSFMGCTKRIGELLLAARPSLKMRCVSVRFGNVLGSQGSVIPLFQKQIRNDRKITITHPDITRFFMTIPEAVSLVLQSFTIGHRGDILVLDMGKPIRILDIARTLVRLSGVPQEEVQIVFTGLRPGEKLYEELFYEFEKSSHTDAEKVIRTSSHVTLWSELFCHVQELRQVCSLGIDSRIRSKVKEIVPQYQWQPSVDDLAMPVAVGIPVVLIEQSPAYHANDVQPGHYSRGASSAPGSVSWSPARQNRL